MTTTKDEAAAITNLLYLIMTTTDLDIYMAPGNDQYGSVYIWHLIMTTTDLYIDDST